MTHFPMNDGLTIPALGLGTWMISQEKAAGAVKRAIELGYRHIDTAQAYGNEAEVGKAFVNLALRVRKSS